MDGFNRARGLKIIDHSLLYEALTHHSYVNDIASKSTQIPFSNRRLEFLGDSVIDVIVSSTLFGRENSTQYKHAIVLLNSHLTSLLVSGLLFSAE